MASARENAIAQIKTDLAGINGSAPYTNTLRRVERGLWSPSELGILPAACVVDAGDSPDDEDSTRAAYSVAEIMVIVWANRSPGTTPDTLANSLLADVRRAMLGTDKIHHNNTCYHVERAEFDTVDVQDAPHIGFAETYRVHYSATWDDQSQS